MSAKFPRGGEQGHFWPAVYYEKESQHSQHYDRVPFKFRLHFMGTIFIPINAPGELQSRSPGNSILKTKCAK